jgi:exodeoxyribonuclease-3
VKVLTFNINGIRARLHQLEAITEQIKPDIIGLQETKVQNKDFPLQAIKDLGYEVVFHGQKSHYGVATLSRHPMQLVANKFIDEDEEAQCRTLITTHHIAGKTITLFNGYFPQGENQNHEIKFPAKRAYYQNLIKFTKQNIEEPLILMGDFNIAPQDIDVGVENPERWLKNGACSFLPEERKWYQELLELGLFDTWRQYNPNNDQAFSWFDYRTRAFERTIKKGLRIDHILCSQGLVKQLNVAGIDYDIRAMEKPSDHVPVWAEFAMN